MFSGDSLTETANGPLTIIPALEWWVLRWKRCPRQARKGFVELVLVRLLVARDECDSAHNDEQPSTEIKHRDDLRNDARATRSLVGEVGQDEAQNQHKDADEPCDHTDPRSGSV